jgi:hypothetical protein
VGLGADDWAILGAYGFYLVDEGMSIGTLQNGFGMHTYWLSTMEVTDGLRVSFFSFRGRIAFTAAEGHSFPFFSWRQAPKPPASLLSMVQRGDVRIGYSDS